VDPVVRQLTQGVTPRKISLSVAVGTGLALFPILGTTTVLCIVVGVALGLNQPILQAMNALCTFIYFPFIYAFIRLGDAIAGPAAGRPDIRVVFALLPRHPAEFASRFGITALHAVLGWAVVAPVWIALVYACALPLLNRAARRFPRKPAAPPA
jgi:uncharacterized protein (DUF2062 family)